MPQQDTYDYLWVFDEIDAGMSGIAGQAVGQLLAQIAQKTQVISVTHLAQVAAYANQHYQVKKTQTPEHTYSEIKALNEMEKLEELTRLIGGHVVSDETKKHALNLIAYANQALQIN
jgi:DNA repair protein RecN (Recombination protein N)